MFRAVPAAQDCPHAPLCEDCPVVVPHVPLGQELGHAAASEV